MPLKKTVQKELDKANETIAELAAAPKAADDRNDCQCPTCAVICEQRDDGDTIEEILALAGR